MNVVWHKLISNTIKRVLGINQLAVIGKSKLSKENNDHLQQKAWHVNLRSATYSDLILNHKVARSSYGLTTNQSIYAVEAAKVPSPLLSSKNKYV